MLFDDLLPSGAADLFADIPGDADASFDRAEATRLESQSRQRADDLASAPSFRVSGSGRDVPATRPQRPADAGVMFDGMTDDQRRSRRVADVGFPQAAREARATQADADAIRRTRPSGTIGPVSDVDVVASRARAGVMRLGLPGGADAAGSLAQAAGDTSIAVSRAIPQTASLFTDVAQLLTAGSVGADTGRVLRQIDADLAQDASFEHRGKAAELARLIEAGDAGGAASFLIANPKFAVDTALPSVATMAPAISGGALAGRLATLPRVVQALPASEIAAIRSGAATAGANAANTAMNAGATYAQTGDYGAAATAGVFSALAGRLTGGGVEGAVARGGRGAVLGTAAREGGQEFIESLGQSIGEQTAENRFAPGQAVAQAAVEGTLGALVGSGAGIALASAPLIDGRGAAVVAESEQRAAEVAAILGATSAGGAIAAAEAALARPSAVVSPSAAGRMRDRSAELLRLETRSDGDLQRLSTNATSPVVHAAVLEEIDRRRQAQSQVLIPAAGDNELLRRIEAQQAAGLDASVPRPGRGFTRAADGRLLKANGGPWTDRARALQAARALGEGHTVVDFDGDGVRGYAVRPPDQATAGPQQASDQTAGAPDEEDAVPRALSVQSASRAAASLAPVASTLEANTISPAPAEPTVRSAVDAGAHQAAASPTNGLTESAAQIEANNRRLGHARVGGLDFSIENPEGSVRQDIRNDPPRWRVTMRNAHYGYIRGTRDNTGEHIDAYVKPGTAQDFAGPVFVVDQIEPTSGRFDEFKVMVGYGSRQEAESTYDTHFDDGSGPRRRGAVTALPWLGFRDWLRDGDTTRPLAYRQPPSSLPSSTGSPQTRAPLPAGSRQPQAGAQPSLDDELILTRRGTLFESRARAQAAADELGRGHRIVRVDKDGRRGWAVKPPPAKEVRVRHRRPGASVKNPLLRLIAQAGGISRAHFRELTGEMYSPQIAMRLGLIEVFRAGGRSIDQIADEVLAGRFLTQAQIQAEGDIGGTRAAADLIADAIRGRGDPDYRPPLALADDESEFERLRDRALDRQRGWQPESEPDDEYLAERAAIEAEADALDDLLTDDDVAAFADPGAPASEAVFRALGFDDDDIATFQAQEASADAGAAAGSRTQAGSDGAGPPGESGRRPDAAEEDEVGDAEPLLANPTPADLQARDARRQRADGERLRREAAPPPGDFVLTGSDRPVDQAEARGQSNLFDAPPPSPIEAAADALQDAAAALKRAVADASIQDVGEKIGGARKDTAARTGARGASTRDESPGWRRRYTISQVAKSTTAGEEGRWVINDSRSRDWAGQPRQIGNSFATREDAEAAVPLAEVARNHRVGYTRDDSGATKFVIWRTVSNRKRVQVVQQLFDSEREAKEYMARNAVDIIETKTSFGEEILPRPDRVSRTGPARRTGDAKGDDFLRDFGFRAVEFGLWEAQDERQAVLNHAYDALADLADVLGVPAKALGLNGELALAFGARGQGLTGARAHYERDYGVINLTKMSGAGSLAHEWMHAADHYFGRQDGKASGERVKNERGDLVFKAKGREDDYASASTSRNSQMRAELKAAYDGVMEAIRFKAEQYVEDTQKADRFVAEARDDVAKRLQQIRDGLARKLEYGSKRAPATPDQLARFDAVAEKIVAGEYLELEWRQRPGSKARFGGYQWSNDALDGLSAIYKEVRGRSGRTEQGGLLADLAGDVKRYGARLKMLAEAQTQTTKTRRLPTAFTTEAKRIDQGRASDYWATPHELLARAFQGYVEDRVADRGVRSDFLTYGTNTVVPTPWGWARPFPEGAERAAINAAFDRFVQVLKTRETDAGVTMFDLADTEPTQSTTREAQDAQAPALDADRSTEARLVGTLQGLLRDRLARPGLVLDHVPAGDGRVLAGTAQARALRAAREFARRALDLRVVFIAQPGTEPAFNGVVHDAIPGTIFLDVNSTRPVWSLFGHELLHSLRRDRPDVYSDLLADLVPLLRPEYAARMRALNAKRAQQGYRAIDDDQLREEFIADIVGDRFGEPAFWQALAQRNPGRFRRVADAILTFLDDLLLRLRQATADVFGTDRYLADVARVRAAVAKAVDRYAEGERVAGTDTSGLEALDIGAGERKTVRTFRPFEGREGRPRLIAKAIADEFETAGVLALVGREVRSPEDLAALAQVYRDPRYETARMFYLRGDTVVHATALSSRLPATVSAFPVGQTAAEGYAEIRAAMTRLGADGYYLLHNHPSGDPQPSLGDLDMTAEFASRVPGMRAHVIVNSNRYGVLTPRSSPHFVILPTDQVIERYFDDDRLLTPALPSDLLGRSVTDPAAVAAIGKSLQRDDWIAVIGASRGVRALAEIPRDLWSNPVKLRGWLRRFARGTGSSSVFAWAPSRGDLEAAGPDQVQKLIADGFLRNAVWGDGGSLRASVDVPAGRVLGYDTQQSTARALLNDGGSEDGAGSGGNPLNAWRLPRESNFAAVRRRLQDYLLRLKVVQDAISEQGGTVGVAQDAYRAEERMHGRIQTQLEQFKAERMRPLMQKLAAAGLTPDDLAVFAYARHAPERNRYIARINPELSGNGSGMSDREASDVLDGFLRDGKFDALEDAHRDLLAITRATRRRLVEAGLISAQQFDAWQAMFAEYVPLRGFERVEIVDGRPEIRPAGGIDVRGPEARHASGRTSRAGTLIENVILDFERAVVRAERNAVGKVFLDLVTSNPDPTLWQVDAPREDRRADDQLALFDLEQAARASEVDRGDDTIAVKVAGRPVYVRIRDPLLLRAMRRAYLDETGDLQRVIAEQIGWYANWLRNTLTRWNPAFVVVNAIRDAQTGAVSTLDSLGWGATTRYAGHYRAALAAAWRNERAQLDPAAREWDRWFAEYKAAGGITGGFFMRDASDVFDELRAEILDAGGSLEARGAGAGRAVDRAFLAVRGLHAAKLAAAVLRGVEMLGGASENAARVAAYRTARELGKSAAEAASIAKNLTVNFNRRGEWGTAMNSLYLFFNAAVQGSHRTLVALANPRVQAAMAGLTALAMALALGNAEWGGDDEDGEANWDKVPDFVKERNLVIMLPPDWDVPGIEDQAGRAKYLKLPLPYGFNVFAVLGNALADGLRNARDPRRGATPAKSAINLTSAVAGSFNPVGGSFDPTDAVQLGLAAAPTILDLPIQLAAERDTWGRPSVPARSAFDARPDAERLFLSDAGTPQQRLSRWLNAATGGDRARSGVIDVAPGTIETAARGTTGGLGQFMADVFTTAGQFTDASAPVSPANVPILKALYGQADNRTDQARFYENRKSIEDRYRQNLVAMKLGIAVDLADPEDRAVMQLGEELRVVGRFLGELRRAEIAAIESDRPEAWKRIERQRLDAERTRLMRSFNRSFNDVLKPARARAATGASNEEKQK